jgi:hypothetical protein
MNGVFGVVVGGCNAYSKFKYYIPKFNCSDIFGYTMLEKDHVYELLNISSYTLPYHSILVIEIVNQKQDGKHILKFVPNLEELFTEVEMRKIKLKKIKYNV